MPLGGAQPPADLQAVQARQHQVEDDEVVVAVLGLGQAGDAVVDQAALAAQFGELQRDQTADVRIVLDHQHAPRAPAPAVAALTCMTMKSF